MRGIVYLFSGVGYADLLATSLWSLRKHCDWPCTIFVTDGQCGVVAESMAADKRLRCRVSGFELPKVRRHASYCAKPLVCRDSPYDQTVLLDADTVITGALDEMVEAPITLTRFCDWVTTGRIMRGRISQWRGVTCGDQTADWMVERSLASSLPAINTGVVGFHSGTRALEDWRKWTLAGSRCSFTDEVAAQILYPGWGSECRLASHLLNCSAKLADGLDLRRAHVIHFHGRSHVRKPVLCGNWWWPHFAEARRENAGGLRDWAGKHDPAVKTMMKQRNER